MLGGGRSGREQVAAARSLLVQSQLLTEQDDQARILNLVASVVQSILGFETVGILPDLKWQDVGLRGVGLRVADVAAAAGGEAGASITLAGAGWAWAYPIPAVAGFLVVAAASEAAGAPPWPMLRAAARTD
jgi:hypothetical protein